jgi:5-methylcytosine-specific restriction endonuclease McrA
MSANDIFYSADALSKRLRALRTSRLEKKELMREVIRKRRSLMASERQMILEKSDSKCHICGGQISGPWDADHVFSHSLGGNHTVSNYLPAHPICNNYRWFYGTEEFQWILKLGVWLRTKIEKKKRIGLAAADEFIRYEQRRHKRRASNAASAKNPSATGQVVPWIQKPPSL